MFDVIVLCLYFKYKTCLLPLMMEFYEGSKIKWYLHNRVVISYVICKYQRYHLSHILLSFSISRSYYRLPNWKKKKKIFFSYYFLLITSFLCLFTMTRSTYLIYRILDDSVYLAAYFRYLLHFKNYCSCMLQLL